MLARDTGTRSAAGSAWRRRLVWFALGATVALAAEEGSRHAIRVIAERDAAAAVVLSARGAHAQSLATPPGEDFDGELVPAAGSAGAQPASPLTLKHHCSWGVPGRNRYRGTVEEALVAARLPAGVIRQISDKVERRSTDGRVAISREGIRSVGGDRHFGRSARAMGFGNTLCFETRVNFRPDHVEYGDLYDAVDEQGGTHSVMVPDVCGNVSVLGARAEEEDVVGGVASASVPESPGWALALVGFVLLAWQRTRRATAASTRLPEKTSRR